MTHRNAKCLMVLTIGAGSLLTAQQKVAPIPAEAYELYSAILKSDTKCTGGRIDADEVVAIGIRAGVPVDKLNESANPVSPEDHELIRSIVRANEAKPAWENRFDFGRPVRLLSGEEFSKAGECAYKESTDGECAPFAGIKW